MHRRPQRTHLDFDHEIGAPHVTAPLRTVTTAKERASHTYELHAERKHVRQMLRTPVSPDDTEALEELDDAVGM